MEARCPLRMVHAINKQALLCDVHDGFYDTLNEVAPCREDELLPEASRPRHYKPMILTEPVRVLSLGFHNPLKKKNATVAKKKVKYTNMVWIRQIWLYL